MSLSDVKISKKLLMAFAVLVAVFVTVSSVVFVNMQSMRAAAILSERANKVLYLSESALSSLNEMFFGLARLHADF